jgi:hypothetical protein
MQKSAMNLDGMMRSLAYLLGGVFLLNANLVSSTMPGVPGIVQGVGWLYIGFGFWMMISIITNRLQNVIHWLNDVLILSLFITTMARLVVAAVTTGQAKFLALGITFPLFVIATWVSGWLRSRAEWVDWFGKGPKRIARIVLVVCYAVLMGLGFSWIGNSSFERLAWVAVGAGFLCMVIAAFIPHEKKDAIAKESAVQSASK